jgi:hypothetical protein
MRKNSIANKGSGSDDEHADFGALDKVLDGILTPSDDLLNDIFARLDDDRSTLFELLSAEERVRDEILDRILQPAYEVPSWDAESDHSACGGDAKSQHRGRGRRRI